MCVLLYRLGIQDFRSSGCPYNGRHVYAFADINLLYRPSYQGNGNDFILVAFAERADYMLRSPRIQLWGFFQVVLWGAVLFMFRTVLAAAAWFGLFSALLFSAGRLLGSRRRTVYITWFAIAAFFVISGRVLTEVKLNSEARSTNLELQMQNIATRESGNKLARYGSRAIFSSCDVRGSLSHDG